MFVLNHRSTEVEKGEELKVKVLEYEYNYLSMKNNRHFPGWGMGISEKLGGGLGLAKIAAGVC